MSESGGRKREFLLLLFLFALAFGLRLGYILQLSAAPFFTDPLGDSQVYYRRALEILGGNWLGQGVYFHSSPPYPYFIALVFALTGRSFMALYVAQCLIGAANCLLIYALAKRLTPGRIWPAYLAGLFAAGYGLLAFFEGDVLMIFLTIFCVDLALLLLLRYREGGRPWLAAAAGVAFGLAALDKTNLLLCAPLLALFAATGLARAARREWRAGLFFLLAMVLTILPVTLRNWVVGRDLVLVSSNGGVNFFIGNNPEAIGIFKAPPGSGLRDPGLEESSSRVAEEAMGRKLRPSEVSRWWAGRTLAFFREHPGQALAKLGWKWRLLFNAYEIPNHMNFYFVRTEIAPILRWMPVGFWLVVPLALVGIAWRTKRGLARMLHAAASDRRSSADVRPVEEIADQAAVGRLAVNEREMRGLGEAGRLYVGFLVCFTLSLVPFFITERYRLPMIPLFIVFAAVSIADFADACRPSWRSALLFWGLGLAPASALVRLPYPPIAYAEDHVDLASAYYEQALREPARRVELLELSTLHNRWALEVLPDLYYAHSNLGLAYEELGWYSGAIEEYRRAEALNPEFAPARDYERRAGVELLAHGDRFSPGALPPTPFQEVETLLAAGRIGAAERKLRALLRRDPFHYEAYHALGLIYLEQGKYGAAIKVARQGLDVDPWHPGLLKDLAAAEALQRPSSAPRP